MSVDTLADIMLILVIVFSFILVVLAAYYAGQQKVKKRARYRLAWLAAGGFVLVVNILTLTDVVTMHDIAGFLETGGLLLLLVGAIGEFIIDL